ncbi:MAG: acyl-CoA dehydrogenase family protein [Polyangiaceae bacterium]|nr:acyl-CoA dehydrogenase family protein [Polyangiaceae bacterium]
MLSTFFTSEHEMFRKNLRDFISREITPRVEEWEREEIFPRELFQAMGRLGYFGMSYPESVGGAGGDYWYNVVYAEELSRCGSGGVSLALQVHSDMATPIINMVGTRAQKEEFLMPAIRGEKIAALGISEPGSGSDVASIRTSARRVGDEYVISGQKAFITSGTRADFITLAVRTGPPGIDGISVLLFPTDTRGFKVTRKLKKIGNHASDTAEIFFDDCRVPARLLLGEENRGFYYLMMNLQAERLMLAVGAIAVAQLAIDEALRYGSQRQVYGHPLNRLQVWRHEFAQMLTEIEAGRWLCYRACDLYERKQDCVKEITMAKLYAAELAFRVTDKCLQYHGGYGYTDEYPISRMWRDVRLLSIGGGTSQMMRELLSRRLGIG